MGERGWKYVRSGYSIEDVGKREAVGERVFTGEEEGGVNNV